MSISFFIVAVVGIIFSAFTLYESGYYQKDVLVKTLLTKRFYFYQDHLLTRKIFRNLYTKLSNFSVYNETELILEVVQLFERTILYGILFAIFMTILIPSFEVQLISLFIPIIMFEVFVNQRVDKVYIEVIRILPRTIQSVRERYQITKSIPRSLKECEVNKYVAAAIEGIYDVVVANDRVSKLEEYQSAITNRYLRILASMCYLVEENGDIKTIHGGSAFVDQLTVLRQEVDSEYFRLIDTQAKLNPLRYTPFLALPMYFLISKMFSGSIEVYQVMMQGVYGAVVKSLIILSAIFAYLFVTNLTRPSVASVIDVRSWLHKLTLKKKFREFLERYLVPTSELSKDKWDKAITGALSSKSIAYIYAQKLITSLTLFVTIILVIIVSLYTYKSTLYSYYGPMDITNQINPLKANEHRLLVEWETKALQELKDDATPEEVAEAIKYLIPTFQDEFIRNAHASRIVQKVKAYRGAKWQWYFIVIAYLFGLVGWFVPELQLALRKKLLSFETAEDVLQLQTLMIILKDINAPAFDCIYWLYKQSTIHKAALLYAFHDFTADPLAAIDRLIFKSGNKDFKILCSKLQASCFDISVADAFSDAYLDKENGLEERKRAMASILNMKYTWGKGASTAPFILSILLTAIAPIILLAIKAATEVFSKLGGQ